MCANLKSEVNVTRSRSLSHFEHFGLEHLVILPAFFPVTAVNQATFLTLVDC